jgi:lantibiotic modifying enzyme
MAAAELLRVGEAQTVGTRWRMDAEFPRTMPNFSHGTAGAAYALARAGIALGDRSLVAAARAGAQHLMSLNAEAADGLSIHHHAPGGEQLFYQSWCHGPAGTARLFHLLASHGAAPLDAFGARALRSIRRSGAPVAASPGYWNNISQCCGHAGIGEAALGLHVATRDAAALPLAVQAADDLLSRGTRDGGTMHWRQAENRGDPTGVQSQTGFMQGAAGVMVFLLRLDARMHGGPTPVELPDAAWYS